VLSSVCVLGAQNIILTGASPPGCMLPYLWPLFPPSLGFPSFPHARDGLVVVGRLCVVLSLLDVSSVNRELGMAFNGSSRDSLVIYTVNGRLIRREKT
jgi:hypothetical protein